MRIRKFPMIHKKRIRRTGKLAGRRNELISRTMLRAVFGALAFLFLIGVFSFLFFAPEKKPATKISVKVYDHRNSKVITMDLEEYITGVVAGEMPISYEPEALKAQALAARTYAYHRILARPGSDTGGADVCTDSGHCQAYSDLESRKQRWGTSFEANEKKLEQAVYETAGIIMTYAGKPIDAMYFSTSGGRTEDAANVYGNAVPYLRGVESPGEEDAPRYETKVTVTIAEFIQTLKKENKKLAVTAKTLAKNIQQPVRFPSGRVDTIQIAKITFTGKQMSKLFSLGTTYFSIEVTAKQVIITTHGYGHGVGMSQVGANAMAKAKSTYVEILCHYYTGIEFSML